MNVVRSIVSQFGEVKATHSEVRRVPLDGVRQPIQQQAAVRGVHPSPWRPEPEGVTRCLHCLVHIGLESLKVAAQM